MGRKVFSDGQTVSPTLKRQKIAAQGKPGVPLLLFVQLTLISPVGSLLIQAIVVRRRDIRHGRKVLLEVRAPPRIRLRA